MYALYANKVHTELQLIYQNLIQYGNVGKEGLCRKSKINPQWGLKLGSVVFYSDASLTEVTSQVLIEGYLTSLSDFEDLAKINRA